MIQEKIKQFKEVQTLISRLEVQAEEFKKDLVELFKEVSKELSVEERWALFAQVVDYLPEHNYILHFDHIDDYISYEGPFHIERHQSIYFGSLIEDLEDMVCEYLEYLKEPSTYISRYTKEMLDYFVDVGFDMLFEEGHVVDTDEDFEANRENSLNRFVLSLKEQFMESGYGSYVYDW